MARSISVSFPALWRHYVILAAIIAVWCATVILTLDSPHDASVPDWIGDEGQFYYDALAVFENGILPTRPFAQDGVYGYHPVMNTVYTAVVMRFFGVNEFGWRMAGVISITVAAVGVYVLGRQLLNPRAALLAVGLLLASHYLFTLAHVGYNNQDGLPPIVWTLVLTVWAIRTKSAWAFAGAGLVMASGFYVFYAGRLGVPLAAIAVAMMLPWREWWRTYPMWGAFCAGLLPTIAAGGNWGEMWARSVGGYSDSITGNRGERILWNAAHNTLAWFYDAFPDVPHDPHHISHLMPGPLADPITMALSIVGFLRGGGGVLLAWLGLSWLASAMTNPHEMVAHTRMFVMLPPLALLAGWGGDVLLRGLPDSWRPRILWGVMAGVVWLNLWY